MANSSNDAPNTSDAHNKVSRQFFQNANAARINTDAHIFNVLQRQYPNIPITIVPQGNCNLKAYANAGHATIESVDQLPTSDTRVWPEALKWTVFIPPVKRLDGGHGVIAEESFFESYLYKWQDITFLVYLVDGRDGTDPWPPVRNQYILGDKSAVHTLVATIGRYQSSLHNEVWVFQGSWVKDSQLYQNVMKSRWEDVILDKGMKDDLIELVERFFSSREQYHRLRVPWKRGVIFYGPPGNGKTLSIKATMRTLYKRNPPIPTLYVKVLLNQYSIDVVFAKARQEAPCYLVFEDLDSLVTDRLRSFFLNAVDGISENEGVFMIGSTNHLDRLDPGIAKRPSRFDRKFLFPNPSIDERVQYCHYWQKKLRDNKEIEFPDEICQAAAKITDGFSFAYIQEAFVTALLSIAREKDGAVKTEEGNEVEELQGAWDLIDIADKEKDLDDYILWRKLKYQIELLRKELGNEESK
ncbi:hypothetical protein LTR47_004416 [Exophiala xenobiotica]|nr:hypothetical protein LTR41_000551 [Exophiala xenobiotica]KAK5226883.1 hypothetical protein LTR72_002872 [Exophiala xenobiotica]KAK5234383.1 hypothetical protein LTR47_004416 [Exophiala xenobiotica]KAK5254856.1 hypothetical protein LTS06_000995 [Exophiala xenobiotica]KAK5262000.1 hypothetical protein LTR40_001072 [Exophiala xenobiotica]